jgi:methylglutaconyl-CoA hydratase
MGFANVINACRTCGKLVIGRIQGKAVGGGVGLASAVDYCFATKYAAVKLSELAIGIGPFVVGPAVERKTGLSAFSQMAIDAIAWQSPEWAKNNGLFNEILEDIPALDARIETFSQWLASQNPDALYSLKSIFWEGTEHWDRLLSDRAAISGDLVLSEFTRSAIQKIKQR